MVDTVKSVKTGTVAPQDKIVSLQHACKVFARPQPVQMEFKMAKKPASTVVPQVALQGAVQGHHAIETTSARVPFAVAESALRLRVLISISTLAKRMWCMTAQGVSVAVVAAHACHALMALRAHKRQIANQ